MKGIYRFEWDCGRRGALTGLFVATTDAVTELLGQEVYFGEVLGKHSEVCGTIDEGDVTLVTDDPAAVSMFEKYELASGRNPLHYTREEEVDDGE